ncbi:VOC family protein [Ectobacillus ponti]|uniref:VOC family protein n=1 Tax=Ectobacillus ponti TaxID=2961894 RepID=A0AA41XAZ3_9BACI|nr:VOC family protein [Ectobacillus ponti]MCP8969615.1 VOC family protein [Ectobacillus ponti]
MRLHHIGVETANLQASLDFYIRLGFTLVDRVRFLDQDIPFLQLGSCTIELLEVESTASEQHLCFEVEDLQAIRGAKIIEGPYTLQNGWKTLFLEGPGGEIIELLQRSCPKI